ncbi:hypothetical protein C8Q80DRAFT_1216364 [Daedaleopsis nitida]|nr:hypothetical protein C8Q80DRAFT_1216364 [Daedaleopsis nitida]
MSAPGRDPDHPRMDFDASAQFDFDNRVVAAVAFTILYYDFLLTISAEVERFWKGRFSWVSIVFLANRYLSALSHIPVVFQFFAILPDPICDRRVVFFLVIILVIGGGLSVWTILTTVRNHQHDSTVIQTSAGAGRRSYYAVTWGVMLIFDAVVFVLTLARTVKVAIWWHRGFFYLILRDGKLLRANDGCMVLIVCHLTNVMTFAVGDLRLTCTCRLSSTLITRMMLNVRDHDRRELSCSQLVLDEELEFRFGHYVDLD